MKARHCIAIGMSAGGIDALKELLPLFKRPSTTAVAIVIHLPPTGPNLIPSLFREICDFEIKEAEPGEEMLAETIYISPPDYHLSVESNFTLSLSTEAPVNFSRPSIDILFDSAAYSLNKNVLGILLTGSNHDGAKGLKKIHEQGGITIVQEPTEALYSEMPQSALDLFKPNYILPLSQMKLAIENFEMESQL